jgi:hypothetical protein
MTEQVDLWAIAKQELSKAAPAPRKAIVLGPRAAGKSSLLRLLRGESD